MSRWWASSDYCMLLSSFVIGVEHQQAVVAARHVTLC
jgi:hypothetical protein